jgi:hypothetical protein
MPVIAVNISPRLYSAVRQLVDAGGYESPEQFLEVAIFNQLAIEKGKAVGPRDGKPEVQGAVALAIKPSQLMSFPAHGSVGGGLAIHDDGRMLDDVIRRLALTYEDSLLPPLLEPASGFADERIWGQINRLFPLKLACRWLAVYAASAKEWPRLRTISDMLADDVGAIGTGLELLDTSLGRKRDDRLSTGLPRRGNSASRDRFISQYIARTTRSGEIYAGAICQFGLAAIEFDEIGLTKFGVELARLSNPLLDSVTPTPPTSTISGNERTLFMQLVKSRVPMERADIAMILDAARTGHTTPTELTNAVTGHLPNTWTALAKRTHIAGVLARAADLSLIRRIWEGRTVTYQVIPSVEREWSTPSTSEAEKEQVA